MVAVARSFPGVRISEHSSSEGSWVWKAFEDLEVSDCTQVGANGLVAE